MSHSHCHQARRSSDDRNMLLPDRWPVDAPEIKSKIKSSVVDAKHEVYTITDEALPSHMRSLLPSHEQQVHDLLTLERTRKRLRYVIISLTIVLALTVLVAVTLVFSFKVKPQAGKVKGTRKRGSSHFLSQLEVADMPSEVKFSLLNGHNRPEWPVYIHHIPEERRTPCVKECWTYAAFRFRSVCDNGYCRCQGRNYDAYTCLPKYDDCQIKKTPSTLAVAKLFGQNQTTYACYTPLHGDDNVHVVSIFGNHRSPFTQLYIKSQSSSRKILVLVNYHFVKWTVHLPKNHGISKVYVVSVKRIFPADQITFLGSADKPEVQVIQRLSFTGYGQDKNGGHTPEMLEVIGQEIGPITSFLGTSHADEITLDLEEAVIMSAASATTSAAEASI